MLHGVLRKKGLFEMDETYKFDKLVGEECGVRICSGECAFWRSGLTTQYISGLQCWTLCPGINGIYSPIVMWYFNPWGDKTFDTTPSPEHPNILQPTRERAICEYIIFREYFSEGILIEGLQTYIRETDNYRERLHEAMTHIPLQKHDWLDYWIQEALEDTQEG